MKEITADDVTQIMVDQIRKRVSLSTGQVAKVLDCSEATIKRWCDKKLLYCNRTPGGHRQIRVTSVAAFMNSPFGQAHRLKNEAITRSALGLVNNTGGSNGHSEGTTRSGEGSEDAVD